MTLFRITTFSLNLIGKGVLIWFTEKHVYSLNVFFDQRVLKSKVKIVHKPDCLWWMLPLNNYSIMDVSTNKYLHLLTIFIDMNIERLLRGEVFQNLCIILKRLVFEPGDAITKRT